MGDVLMADYCWQCTEMILGMPGETNGHKGRTKPGKHVYVICEGCGLTFVDHQGRCTGRFGSQKGCDLGHAWAPEGCLRVCKEPGT